MKKVISAAASMLMAIVLYFNISASGIKIDGMDDGTEWEYAQHIHLFSGDSHSSVVFGYVSCCADSKNRDIMLCVLAQDKELDRENQLAGLRLTVDGNEYRVYYNIETEPLSDEYYTFDAHSSVDENNGATCEIIIGVKNGIGAEFPMKIQFIDSEGNFSNIYSFSVKNSELTSTAAAEKKSVNEKTEKITDPVPTVYRATLTGSPFTARPKRTEAPKAEIRTVTVTVTMPEKKRKTAKTEKPAETAEAEKPSASSAGRKSGNEFGISEAFAEESLANDLAALSQSDKYKVGAVSAGAVFLILIALFSAIGAKKKDKDSGKEKSSDKGDE